MLRLADFLRKCDNRERAELNVSDERRIVTRQRGHPMTTDPRPKIQFMVIPDPNYPGSWRVEGTDPVAADVCLATFLGPFAEERANEYARWKNGQEQTIDRTNPRVGYDGHLSTMAALTQEQRDIIHRNCYVSW